MMLELNWSWIMISGAEGTVIDWCDLRGLQRCNHVHNFYPCGAVPEKQNDACICCAHCCDRKEKCGVKILLILGQSLVSWKVCMVPYSYQIACPPYQTWCLVWKHSFRQVDYSCNLAYSCLLLWCNHSCCLVERARFDHLSGPVVTCCDLTLHLPSWLPSLE